MSWFVIKVINNKEKKIKESLENELKKNNIQNINFLVPTQNIVQIRKGKKISVEKNIYPGYILVECDTIDNVEKNIKHITGVYHVLKQPLSQSEVNRLIGNSENKKTDIFSIDQRVKIVDGPFSSFYGTIKTVDNDKQKAKVSINIFDRENIIDLTFLQIVAE